MFSFAGEFFYLGKGCQNFNPEPTGMMNLPMTYLVISNEGATCLAE